MSGRKPVAKRSAKKKDDAFIPSDNSDRDSQSDDPEIQKLLEKIEKINEAEEGAKPQKKRARKEPAKPASVQDPVPFRMLLLPLSQPEEGRRPLRSPRNLVDLLFGNPPKRPCSPR